MTVHLVTFSDESMSRAARLCIESARQNGVRHAHRYAPAHVEELLLRNGINPLARGCGYWAWKPALLNQIMGEDAFVQNVRNGDVIVYADAGVEFINNVSHIIDRMGHEKPQDDIWLFGNNWEHAHWCKADVVEAVWPQAQACGLWERLDEYPHDVVHRSRFGKQVQASVIFFRVSDYSRAFVAEWLKWCLFEGGRLIDDSPSRAPNHPEFQEHRHDQAILTTLAYRECIPLHWWPSVYNKGGSPEFVYEKLSEYAGDDYPVLFSHHRKRNHEFQEGA